MKEWRGAGRHGDVSIEPRDEVGRQRSRWESPPDDLDETPREALGSELSWALSAHLDPATLARLRSKVPGKVTRAERALLLGELGAGAMLPEVAWSYARWLLSDERGWRDANEGLEGPRAEQAPRQRSAKHVREIERGETAARQQIGAVDHEALGELSSAFGFLPRIVRFEDLRAIALRQMLGAADAHGGDELRRATSEAARTAPRRWLPSHAGPRQRPLSGAADAGDLAQRGQAMWRAAERRGAMLYRRALDAGAVSDDGPEVATALQRCGAGQALPASVQRTMEARLGVALGRVRVHLDEVADQAARAVHAVAFTVGEDIFFARGAFAPGTESGDRLLAHELTHVVQAWQGRSDTRRGDEAPRVSRPDEALEREAEQVAERIARGERQVMGGATAPGSVASRSGAAPPTAGRLPTTEATLGDDATSRPSSSSRTPAPVSPEPAPGLSPHAQRVLRRAEQPATPRASIPSIKGGLGRKPRADGNALAALHEMRGASREFTGRASQASARSMAQLEHGMSAARATPPGKGALAQAAGGQRAARAGEEESRALERQQRAKAEARASQGGAAAAPSAHKGDKLDTSSPIQLKAIDDWSRHMPAPLPDQDERERRRVEQLVKKKIQRERRQAQGALEQLRAAHLRHARNVRAMKPKLQGQIAGAERQALSKVSTDEATQSGAVRAHVAALQGQVRAHAATMKAQVAHAHRAAVQKIDDTHKTATDRLTKGKSKALDEVKAAEALALLLCSMDFLNARARFTALGGKKAGDAIAVGEEEAGKMAGRWDGEKLEAAQNAARETADGFASSMTEQAGAALAQLEATRPDAELSLRDLAKSVRDGIERSYEASRKALDEAQRASKRAADAASKAAQGQIDQACSSAVAALSAHGASQVAAVIKQAQRARGGIASAANAARVGAARACDQAASGIEKGVLGLVRGARQLEAPNPDETNQQVAEGSQSLERGAQDLAKGLGKTASASASGLQQQASSAAEGMAAIAASAKATATQLANGVKRQMTVVARGAADSVGELAQAHRANSDETVKAAEAGFGDQVKALRDAYEDAATQRAKQLDDNYGQCASSLGQAVPDRGGGRGGSGSGKKGEEGGESGGAAKDEISSIRDNAQKAADAVKPWWQKALAVVVSIVVAVVVTIVVTALVATTGPIGMALVGAAAGALASVAGSMASNLVLGNGLFDGITWKSVLIGALGGGLGAGLTAGLGAGAGALAQSARFAGTAIGRGAQATAAAVQGTAQGFGQLAIKTGIEAASDLISEQTANLIVTGKLDVTVEGLVLSLVTSAVTSHPKFETFQGAVQSGIQRHTPIRVDVPALQIQVGTPQATGGGGATSNGNDGGSSGGGDGSRSGGVTARPDGEATPQRGRSESSKGTEQGPVAAATPDGASVPSERTPVTADPTPDGATPRRDADRRDADKAGADKSGRDGEPAGASNAPATDKQTTDRQAADRQATDEQTTDRQAADRQATDEQTADKPAADKPAADKPAHDEQAHGAPATDKQPPDTTDHGGPPAPDKQPHGEQPPDTTDHGGPPAPDKQPHGATDHGGPTATPTSRDSDSNSSPDTDVDESPVTDGAVAARDAELGELGYPEGTRAKADELAAKIEQGEVPSQDLLRDTEANQRGVRELRELLADPRLPPEAKVELQRALAARLREQADPTGDLARDLESTRPRARREQGAAPAGAASTATAPARDATLAMDGDDTTQPGDRGAASGIDRAGGTYRGDVVTRDNTHNVRAGVEDALPKLATHFPPDTVRQLGSDHIEIMSGGNSTVVRIEIVPKDQLAAPTDVANFDLSQTPPVIKLSGNANKAHVERALAHEVAEIKSILDARGGDRSRGTVNSLHPDSLPSRLSHHDIGRLAELRVLMSDLSTPGRSRSKTTAELRALLSELGLINPNGSLVSDRPGMQRRALVEAAGVRLDDVAAALSGKTRAADARAALYDGVVDQHAVHRMVAELGDTTLRGLEARLLPQQLVDMFTAGGAGNLRTLRDVIDLERAGRLTGLNDWMDFVKTKDPVDLDRAFGELREASRLVAEHPGQVINIGGDKRAPLRPNRESMRSFDMTVEGDSGAVSHSVEVTTVDAPVAQYGDITTGIKHSIHKVTSRQRDGAPIPGQHEVSIRMQLAVGDARIGGGRTRRIGADGEVRIIDADGQFRQRPGNPTNLFDDIASNLNQTGRSAISDLDKLDRINLVDINTGSVIAVFERAGAQWRRAS